MASAIPRDTFKPQKLGLFNDALVIHIMDFPIFYMECISERHFVVAGGGGSSKTGVKNQINMLELIPTGDPCAAILAMKYITPEEIPDAIMAAALMRDLPIIKSRLVSGGIRPAVYDIDFDARIKSFAIRNYEMLEDAKLKSEVKCIKYYPRHILTGSIDGQLSLWEAKGNNLKIIGQSKAHTKEISEVDVDLVSQQIVTLSRDEGRCAIWNLENFKLLQEFKRESINEGSNQIYTFRSCRYAYDTTMSSPNLDDGSFLVAACNPVALKAKDPSKLMKWSTKDYKNKVSISVHNDAIRAMTVSLDGKYVAVGTGSGSVLVVGVRNFKPIYRIDQAHHNAVTSLAFLDPKSESLHLTDSHLCALLSSSIDRRIVLHRPKRSSIVKKICSSLFLAVIMCLIFFVSTPYIKEFTSSAEQQSNS